MKLLKWTKDKYYHKNTSNVFASVGNMLGGDFVEHKPYSLQEEEFVDKLMTEVIGSGLLKAGSIAFKLLKKAGGSLWKLPAIEMESRGFVYEKMLKLKGAFKAHSFPIIDAFYKGVATSVKTLDIFAPSYKINGKIFSKLKGYVNDLHSFEGAEWGGDVVENISSKVLELGIPKGATKMQKIRQ